MIQSYNRNIFFVLPLISLVCSGMSRVHAQTAAPQVFTPSLPTPIVVSLWPSLPPNAVPGATTGADDGTGRWRNVGIPAMLVYLPGEPPDGKKRIAIIACPGGGYTHLTRLEGADGAVREFLPRDVVVISLRYRLNPPSTNVAADALADGQRAIRLARYNAAAWGIDPNKIGMIGWSAGANLELNVASHATPGDSNTTDPVDRESSIPAFVALLSPWPNSLPISAYPISNSAPPAFIGSARDDKTAPFTFAQSVKAEYDAAGVASYFDPVDTGGHGSFTIGGTTEGADWPDVFWDWLDTIHVR